MPVVSTESSATSLTEPLVVAVSVAAVDSVASVDSDPFLVAACESNSLGESTPAKKNEEEEVENGEDPKEDDLGDDQGDGGGFNDDLDDKDDDVDEFDDIDEDDFDDNFDDDFEEELEDDYEIEIDDEISAEFGLDSGAAATDELKDGLDEFDDFENIV